MNPNPRIHKPLASSFLNPGIPTITQSTALWKAMKHREELEHKRERVAADIARHGFGARLRHAFASLPFFG